MWRMPCSVCEQRSNGHDGKAAKKMIPLMTYRCNESKSGTPRTLREESSFNCMAIPCLARCQSACILSPEKTQIHYETDIKFVQTTLKNHFACQRRLRQIHECYVATNHKHSTLHELDRRTRKSALHIIIFANPNQPAQTPSRISTIIKEN